MSGFHECELKVKIDDQLSIELRKMVINKGYVLTDSRVETDYIIDILLINVRARTLI